MSRSVTIDGETYNLPTGSERNWLANLNALLLALIDAVNASGGATPPAGILFWGAQEIVSGDTTALYPGYADAVAAEFDVQIVAPRAGTLTNLYARHTNATTSADVVYTVRVNSVNSDLACTIAGGASAGNNTADEVAVNAGDRISITVQAPSTTPTLIVPSVSCLFTPSAPS